MKKPIFTGHASALITPFKNGEIDFEALERLIAFQLAGGVDAFVVNGTTQYYVIMNDGSFDAIYRMSAAEVPEAALLNVGDTISIIYEVRENEPLCAGTIISYDVMQEEIPVEVPLVQGLQLPDT